MKLFRFTDHNRHAAVVDAEKILSISTQNNGTCVMSLIELSTTPYWVPNQNMMRGNSLTSSEDSVVLIERLEQVLNQNS